MSNRATAMRGDSKEKAILCVLCGGWPAPIRPRPHSAYCEDCAKKKNIW